MLFFARDCCEKCPHRDKCRPREQKKNYAVHVSKNMAERAAYLRQLSTEAYKKYTLNEHLIKLQNWLFYVKIESVLLFMDKT